MFSDWQKLTHVKKTFSRNQSLISVESRKILFLSSLSYILHHPDFYIIFLARMLNFKTLTFLFHLLDQDPLCRSVEGDGFAYTRFDAQGNIFGYIYCRGVNFNLKLVITALRSAVHDKGNYLCVVMLESLILIFTSSGFVRFLIRYLSWRCSGQYLKYGCRKRSCRIRGTGISFPEVFDGAAI